MDLKMIVTRGGFDRILALGGVLIIVLQVLYMAADPTLPTLGTVRAQIGVVLLGLVLNQIGVWRLSSQVFPNRRLYQRLRIETDHFITLVRQLNTHVINNETGLVGATKTAMHESVDRMVEYAGVVGEFDDEEKS